MQWYGFFGVPTEVVEEFHTSPRAVSRYSHLDSGLYLYLLLVSGWHHIAGHIALYGSRLLHGQETYGKPPGDPVEDLNVNLAIW